MMQRSARMLTLAGWGFLTALCGCVSVGSQGGLDQGKGSVWSATPAKPATPATPATPAKLARAPLPSGSRKEVVQASFEETQPDDAKGKESSSGKAGPIPTLPPPRLLPPDAVPGRSLGEVNGSALALGEVVASVETHYPLLMAALEEQGITSGQLLSAQGAFDLNLRVREFWQVGTYDSNRVSLGVDQNTDWHGVSFFAAYRYSTGDFPIYYGDRKTGDGGEFRAGVIIPLLAGRAIDRRRATRQQAAISRAMVEPAVAAQRLDFVRAASRAYWTWVAVGKRYQVAQAVLKIAEDRDKQLSELVKAGALAEIERTDNQRVIVERQARVIAAERAWQQASIALSLYLRSPTGDPLVPSAGRLPQAVAEPVPFDRSRVNSDMELALQQRPELERIRLQRERVAVELELARNQAMPSINLGLEGYQDIGYAAPFSKTPLVKGTQLDRTAYIASLSLDLPLQQRDARGRALTAQSAIAQLGFQEKFQRDRVVAEVQDAASALERSYEMLNKARENVTVARKVESGERERFTKGQGTIVILNLRELVAAEASFAEVDALAEYYRALADYRAALGQPTSPRTVPGEERPRER